MLSQEAIKRLITCVLLTLRWTIVSGEQPCDINTCPGVQKLYTEVGCTPLYKLGNCCPIEYECPDFSARRKDKCYVFGQEFAVDESIPEEVVQKNCVPHCRCAQYDEDKAASLICSHYDCAEFFGRHDPTCTMTYSMDSCCSTGRLCGEEKTKAAKCYFEGKSYIVGERMYPEDRSCYKCMCTADFDNSTIDGNPNCQQINCGFDLHYGEKLRSRCAPIYYGNNKCCPIGWRCPDGNKDEVVVKSRNDFNTKNICVFGDLRLSVGDELKADNKEVTCSCATPPYLQCIREKHADY